MVAAVSLSAPRTARTPTRSTPRAASSSRAAPRRRPRSSSSSGPLKGVVAVVDVRVGADAQIDCSDVVARKLRELGASTVKRVTPKLTHIVLSHFTPLWKTKITKWQAGGGSMAAAALRFELKIVSQLWVNACYVSKQRMDERPFFPVSQQMVDENAANRVKPKLKRRQSMGADADNTVDTAEKTGMEIIEAENPPPSELKVSKVANGKKRKRRALSMEPMTSDAILKMLGTTEEIQVSTPKQPISKTVTSSAKRRKTLNGPPTKQDEDEVTASQVSGIVAESESENEKEDESKTEVIEIMDSQASQLSSSSFEKKLALAADTGSNTTPTNSGFSGGTPDDGSTTTKKEPTAREMRRHNRTSLSYGSGLTLKTGIWSCAACGCSNPRTRRFCTDCHATKGSAKSPGTDSLAGTSPATAATVSDSPKTPASPVAASSAHTTPKIKTPTPKKRTSTPGSLSKMKTPSCSSSVVERTPRSLTRPTASSAAKMRTPSPAVSRMTRSLSRETTPGSAIRSRTQSPATRSSITASQKKRISLASASVSKDVVLKKSAGKKAQRKLPTTTEPSSALKLSQSAANKRARPPVSSSILTTPVVKKARRDNKESVADTKCMTTPGSVSMFPRKYREVNSTPIPMALSFSSTTSRKTPSKSPRNVIGITGVSPETRGVLQCAIHAIDANVANESGQRKARVVKSADYSSGVTHLIVGKETRRTIKVLFAIARGAWIVTEDWAFSSLEQERWLPEENFEVAMFGNKYSREHPESRLIFSNMKFFVGPNVEPSREILQSLIQVAGGEICKQISVADICICGDSSVFRRAQRTGVRAVTSKWVFDCISSMKIEEDAKYVFTDPIGTPAKTPKKTTCSRAAGLEAHSTVQE